MITISEQPDDISFSRNPVRFKIRAADESNEPWTPENIPPGYIVKMEVMFQPEYVPASDEMISVCIIPHIPDPEGYIYLDLQDILDAEIKNSFSEPPIPPIDIDAGFNQDILRKYMLRVWEESDEDEDSMEDSMEESTIDTTDSDVLKVLCGGIAPDRSSTTEFFDAVDASNSLLTWWPNGKHVSPDQPEYLSHLAYDPQDDSERRIRVEMFDYEGTLLGTVEKYHNTPIYRQWQIATFPVGFDQLGLGELYDNIAKYTVEVRSGSNVKSQTRTYYVDRQYYECKLYLLYLNGFCCPEIVRFTGEETIRLKVERQKSAVTRPYAFNPLNGDVQQHNALMNNVLILRSGFFSQKEVMALQEVLAYNMVWRITTGGYKGLDMLDNEYEITESLKFLNSIEVRAEYSVKKKIIPTIQ